MTTDYGFRFALSAVNSLRKNNMVLIWSATPCTGGSPWQNINKLLPGGEERIQSHLKMSRSLWKNLAMFVDWIISMGKDGEFVLSGQRIAPIGIVKRFDHVLQNGMYRKFVLMVALLV